MSAAAASVPFLCDIARSARLVNTEPLAKLNRWLIVHPELAAQAVSTLLYLDVTSFVQDLACPALVAY